MQMRKVSIYLSLVAPMALVAGCALTTTTDEDSRAARLPTGVTLLESDQNECDGLVQIDEDSVGGSRRSDLVIQQGQNATFEVDEQEDEIGWSCVGESDSDEDTVDCPDNTSHVRITRASTGDDFLLECYGRRAQ
jgi:hypothetical protein